VPPPGKALRHPATWLAVFLVFAALVAADSFRTPSRQVSVRVFTAAVAGYHHYLHPITGRWIHCRYQPTCSRYSVEAVRKYGIAKGLALSFRRIRSCRQSVPMGTRDPVP
jgi:putative membrane protein insertion efficiency factor